MLVLKDLTQSYSVSSLIPQYKVVLGKRIISCKPEFTPLHVYISIGLRAICRSHSISAERGNSHGLPWSLRLCDETTYDKTNAFSFISIYLSIYIHFLTFRTTTANRSVQMKRLKRAYYRFSLVTWSLIFSQNYFCLKSPLHNSLLKLCYHTLIFYIFI